MKELPKQFSGKGEVSGYSFHQIAKTNVGYISFRRKYTAL